jgi:hypothetical protein
MNAERQEGFKQFSALLLGYFEKVKKNLPKKYASIKDFVAKMGGTPSSLSGRPAQKRESNPSHSWPLLRRVQICH